jgi:hypothetical protein
MFNFFLASVFHILATNVHFLASDARFGQTPPSYWPDPLSFWPDFPAKFNVHIATRLAEASEHIPKKRSQVLLPAGAPARPPHTAPQNNSSFSLFRQDSAWSVHGPILYFYYHMIIINHYARDPFAGGWG